MARKTLARKAAPVTLLSGGVDQVSTALHKLHANCSDQVVEAMRNSSASRREMVIQPLRLPE
jgi:hypothetical protein